MSRSSSLFWSLPAVVLVGLNLRPALAAIGPLLDTLQARGDLNDTLASLLTTLPVLLMGVGALCAPLLLRRLGVRLGVALGVLLIGLACALRLAEGAAPLLGGALLAGLGIAACQALLPAFIRQRFAERSGGAMGFYTTAIMGGAVLASVGAPQLAHLGGSSLALAVWSLPALLAFALWCWASGAQPALQVNAAGARLQRGRRAWLLALFFGLGTGGYVLVLAWLPPYYTALGWSPAAAGGLLGGLTVAEVVAGLLVSALIDRLPDRRLPLFLAISAVLVGLLMLISAPLSLALPAAVVLGLGIGALFPLSLIVSMDHATSPAQAGALVGFVQGVGYLIAALFPLLAGVARQSMSSLVPAWWAMAGVCLVMLVLASRFAPAPARLQAAGAA
ncbi:MAG: putative transporter YycB [Stenotrophomonas maltophilia]|nr:MAG: putative transporter YycB [Stenotrophomonas maltophilia]